MGPILPPKLRLEIEIEQFFSKVEAEIARKRAELKQKRFQAMVDFLLYKLNLKRARKLDSHDWILGMNISEFISHINKISGLRELVEVEKTVMHWQRSLLREIRESKLTSGAPSAGASSPICSR